MSILDRSYSFAGEFLGSYSNISDLLVDNFLSINIFKNVFIYFKYQSDIKYIESRLAENNIPNDFKYITLIESKIQKNALSSVGALGVWQFMPETAERFGLRVHDKIDERLDFHKSTDAAIEYFQILYDQFGKWTLVAAAYSRGENAIADALEEQGVQEYYYLDLNEETGNYVYRILGLKFFVELFEDE